MTTIYFKYFNDNYLSQIFKWQISVLNILMPTTYYNYLDDISLEEK